MPNAHIDNPPLAKVAWEFKASPELAADLMITAIESGWSDTWCGYINLVKPAWDITKVGPWYADPELYKPDSKIELLVEEREDDGTVYKSHRITIEDIKNGFLLLATQAPWRFKEIEEDNMDAITADCWLQCVVLGEIVYG